MYTTYIHSLYLSHIPDVYPKEGSLTRPTSSLPVAGWWSSPDAWSTDTLVYYSLIYIYILCTHYSLTNIMRHLETWTEAKTKMFGEGMFLYVC